MSQSSSNALGHPSSTDSVAKLLTQHFGGADQASNGAVYTSLARLTMLGLLDERCPGVRAECATTQAACLAAKLTIWK